MLRHTVQRKAKGHTRLDADHATQAIYTKITVDARSTWGYYNSILTASIHRCRAALLVESIDWASHWIQRHTETWSLPRSSELFSERLSKCVSHAISKLIATINTRHSHEPIIYILSRES